MTKTRKFHIALIAVTIIAFIIRIQVCGEMFDSVPIAKSPTVGTDMYKYKALSEAIFTGTFTHSFYFQPFYYAVFIPFIYFIAGMGIWKIVVAQAILGSLTVWLTGASAALIRNRRTGIISALLVTFSLMLIFYTAFLLIVTLKAFLISLFLYLGIIAFRKDKWYHWASLAIIGSFLFLTRANTLFFIPVIMIAAFMTRRGKITSPPNTPLTAFFAKCAPVALILVLFIVPQVPFIIHNSKNEGKLTLPSTAGPVNLAIGNNPEACPGGLSYTQTSNYWIKHADEISIPTRIIVWLRKSPLSVIELTFRKLLLFWDAENIFDNMKGFDKIKNTSEILRYFPFIPMHFYLIAFLSVVIIFRKKIFHHKKLFVPFIMVILYWVSVAAFINLTRYKLAILPLMSVFAAILFDKCIFQSKSPKKLIKLIVVFAVMSIFVYRAYPFYRFTLEKRVFALIQPQGTQITLGRDKIIVDNGPFSMGSWIMFPFANEISKKFAISPEEIGKKGEFHIFLVCKNKTPFQININEKTFTAIPLQKNMTFKFRITIPKDGVIRIAPKRVKAGTLFASLDLQRNYGRTSINKKSLPGELVCRLIVDRYPDHLSVN